MRSPCEDGQIFQGIWCSFQSLFVEAYRYWFFVWLTPLDRLFELAPAAAPKKIWRSAFFAPSIFKNWAGDGDVGQISEPTFSGTLLFLGCCPLAIWWVQIRDSSKGNAKCSNSDQLTWRNCVVCFTNRYFWMEAHLTVIDCERQETRCAGSRVG